MKISNVCMEIAKARKRLNLSQRDFAKKLGVHGSTVWRWEMGRTQPRAETMNAITSMGLFVGHEAKTTTTQNLTVSTTPEKPTKAPAKVRQTEPNGIVIECALLNATAQITSAWIASHKFPAEPHEAKKFVLMLTQALRQES